MNDKVMIEVEDGREAVPGTMEVIVIGGRLVVRIIPDGPLHMTRALNEGEELLVYVSTKSGTLLGEVLSSPVHITTPSAPGNPIRIGPITVAVNFGARK